MEFKSDAVRDILLFLEKNIIYEINPDSGLREKTTFLPGQVADLLPSHKYTKDEVIYVIELMVKEGYLLTAGAPKLDSSGNFIFLKVNDISLSGHELLNNIRDERIWTAVKRKAKSLGGFSLKTLSGVAASLGTTLMSDPNALNNFLKGVENIKDMIL